MNMPAPPPPTQGRPESTQLRHSIREEPEEDDDDLYSDVMTSGDVTTSTTTTGDDDDPYSYAQVEMRRKKLKFVTQSAVDYDAGASDDAYTEVGADYSSVHERASNTSSNVTASPYGARPPSAAKSASAGGNMQQQQQQQRADSSHLPEYSKVIPKAERMARATSAREKSTPGRERDDDYVYLRDATSNKHTPLFSTKSMLEFATIPSLRHPRVEYTDRSHFDDIRLFLSRNRGMDEIFRDPPKAELSGNSINKLTNFLSHIAEPEPEIYSTHL